MALKYNLNKREEEILNFIKNNIHNKGYPPSVREIGQAVGLKSSSTVHSYLRRLESMGLLRRDPAKPRAIELMQNHGKPSKEMISVPVLGKVAAGEPLLALENYDDSFPLPVDFVGHGEFFMLSIKGDSMIEAGILEGDLVLVRRQPCVENGDICVALIEDEATIKRFFKENDHIRLQPENYRLSPLLVKEVQILGKVAGLVRKF
ncbi:SOS regulatory protein LexA [Desulfoscipio gibsoniae DSM 7213]|uniref:LexA repressor n=1 Tax=Desulfoscipio gibsoniae DSM 7213 TaxID=767817 RepID=R4KLG7_9FIRM|nr:SOS regulatory protein LexA [Desulfoscipio gibsoniae DSM 7213]